jgi:hypothetical protein
MPWKLERPDVGSLTRGVEAPETGADAKWAGPLSFRKDAPMSGIEHTSRRPSLRRLLIGLVALLVPFAGAATAQAADTAARCEGRVIEQPFTAWEDPADYFLAPDGDFSAGAAGWDLAGAEVVDDNEPWFVHGGDAAAAVWMESGASATSPSICVGQDDPTMRFFARSVGDAAGTLSVEVLYADETGESQALTIGTIGADGADGAAEWIPVAPLLITANTYEMSVAFRFTAQGTGSTWLIDDVFVDPYRKG